MENFLQNELRKVFRGSKYDVVYIGNNNAYVIAGNCRIWVSFYAPVSSNCYCNIYMKAIHKENGELAFNNIGIREIIGLKKVANPNYPNGFAPYIFKNCDSGKYRWNIYQPDWKDYEAIRTEIEKFAGLFV